ncbi:MAG: NADH-quinone oxidoreductase subunit N, partial [Candidatus Limnocylindrales bacterium]
MTGPELLAIAPFGATVGLAILLVIVDLIRPGADRAIGIVATAGLLGVAALTLYAGAPGTTVFGGAYVRDALTYFLDLLFLVIALLTVLFAPDYLRPRHLPMAEFSTTLLFAISGAMLIDGSRDLLVLFLGLELLVLPGYLLAGYAKRDGLSTEGAIKYFLLGSFSSAIFLFGLAFTWGYTGTTRIAEVGSVMASQAGLTLSAGLAMGLALLTAGVAFKIAAVPFHYWTPDAYQGSPTPVTGYLSVGPKVAAFALILRLFVEALGPLKADWVFAIVVLAALTMTLGNLVALTQDNIKRMLAYSSIAHTGYILVGLAAFAGAAAGSPAERAGLEGLLFY